jgi:hypothetical protein
VEGDVVRAEPTSYWASVPQISGAEGKSDLQPDHAHMLISISPPKEAVSQVAGFWTPVVFTTKIKFSDFDYCA